MARLTPLRRGALGYCGNPWPLMIQAKVDDAVSGRATSKQRIRRELQTLGAIRTMHRLQLVFQQSVPFEHDVDPGDWMKLTAPRNDWCAWLDVDGRRYGPCRGTTEEEAVDRLMDAVSFPIPNCQLGKNSADRLRLRAFFIVAVRHIRKNVLPAQFKAGMGPKQIGRTLIQSAHRMHNGLALIELQGGAPASRLLRDILRTVIAHTGSSRTPGTDLDAGVTLFREAVGILAASDRPEFHQHITRGSVPDYAEIALGRTLQCLEKAWIGLGLRLGRRNDAPFVRLVKLAMSSAGVKGIDVARLYRRMARNLSLAETSALGLPDSPQVHPPEG